MTMNTCLIVERGEKNITITLRGSAIIAEGEFGEFTLARYLNYEMARRGEMIIEDGWGRRLFGTNEEGDEQSFMREVDFEPEVRRAFRGFVVRPFEMQGVRGDTATPGEFRRSQNWIGPPGFSLRDATYVPPPVDELMGCLDALERFLHDEKLPSLVHAGIAHSQFEAVHPFPDGNGRVGRLLISLLLAERDLLPSPLLQLSAWFETTREEYYAHLLAVTREGAWGSWLVYCLEGVHAQAADALARIQDIDDLYQRWREELAGVQSGRPEQALRLFVGNPFRTVRGVARELGVAYTTARRALDRLEDVGIVSRVGPAKRNRVYCARAMLEILEAPHLMGRTAPAMRAAGGEAA